MGKRLIVKRGCDRTVISITSWEFPPRHGSHAALPIACDALNARTVAVRKYHCIFCVSLPANRYTCFPARCWSLGCPGGDNLARIASWRTRRMARRKRNVSDLPYAAPPLSCAAFFSRFKMAVLPASTAERKKGERESVPPPLRLFLCPKGEDSHHQILLAAVPECRGLRQNRRSRARRTASAWRGGLCSR